MYSRAALSHAPDPDPGNEFTSELEPETRADVEVIAVDSNAAIEFPPEADQPWLDGASVDIGTTGDVGTPALDVGRPPRSPRVPRTLQWGLAIAALVAIVTFTPMGTRNSTVAPSGRTPIPRTAAQAEDAPVYRPAPA